MKASNGRLSGDGSAQTRRHGGGAFGAITPKFFVTPNFNVLRNICFEHMMKIKRFPPKNVFSPQVLKPGYGPGSDKIVSAIRIFLF